MASWRDRAGRIATAVTALAAVAVMLACCASPTASPVPLTPDLTVTRAVTPDVRIPSPGTVEVVLRVAPDSWDASFSVRDAQGALVFQTYWPLAREYRIYLLPGDYTWSASAPIPTPPAGCYVVEESTDFTDDGSFTAVRDRIEIEVRYVYRISYCTPTPGS